MRYADVASERRKVSRSAAAIPLAQCATQTRRLKTSRHFECARRAVKQHHDVSVGAVLALCVSVAGWCCFDHC
jgi:hypothetical protein